MKDPTPEDIRRIVSKMGVEEMRETARLILDELDPSDAETVVTNWICAQPLEEPSVQDVFYGFRLMKAVLG